MRPGPSALLAAFALSWCVSCPVLGRGEEEQAFAGDPTVSADRVPVVDDVGPFDPSEAVDDDDGPVVLDEADDPTDRAAFAEQDEGSRGADAAENENAEGEGARPGKDGELVAAPAEVAAREAAHRRELARAEEGPGDEDERKAELAANPPPEPAPESKDTRSRVLGHALDALLVVVVTALLAAAVVFATSHPRSVALGAVVLVAAAWFVWSQRA